MYVLVYLHLHFGPFGHYMSSSIYLCVAFVLLFIFPQSFFWGSRCGITILIQPVGDNIVLFIYMDRFLSQQLLESRKQEVSVISVTPMIH